MRARTFSRATDDVDAQHFTRPTWFAAADVRQVRRCVCAADRSVTRRTETTRAARTGRAQGARARLAAAAAAGVAAGRQPDRVAAAADVDTPRVANARHDVVADNDNDLNNNRNDDDDDDDDDDACCADVSKAVQRVL